MSLGIGAGDTVAIPSYVCAALLQAVRHAGADVLLVDSGPEHFSPAKEDLSGIEAAGIRVIIFPHLFGIAGDLPAIIKTGVPFVEDCAMSLGASCDSRPLGSYGALGVFSFYATKMICAGEGGALTTDDEGLADTLRDLRDYDGRNDDIMRFNYKLTDIQATIARVQLGKLDQFIARRRVLAQRYSDGLSSLKARLPEFRPGDVAFRYVIRHTDGPDALIPRFEDAGVAARKPVNFPLHRLMGLDAGGFAGAESLFTSAISLPLYPALTDQEAEKVVEVAGELL